MTEMTPTVLPRAEFKSPGQSVPQDWAALARWLARSGAELGATPGRQFAGSFGNLNYLIEIDGKPAVLRRPPSGPLPLGANDMGREHRILSSLWRAYPLAPRALFFCAEPGVLGAPFQIIEYRAGIAIRDAVPPSLTGGPDIGATLSRQMVESLAALHAVDAAQIGLATLGLSWPNPRWLVATRRGLRRADRFRRPHRDYRMAALPGAGGCAADSRAFRFQARQYDPRPDHPCPGRGDRLGYGDSRRPAVGLCRSAELLG